MGPDILHLWAAEAILHLGAAEALVPHRPTRPSHFSSLHAQVGVHREPTQTHFSGNRGKASSFRVPQEPEPQLTPQLGTQVTRATPHSKSPGLFPARSWSSTITTPTHPSIPRLGLSAPPLTPTLAHCPSPMCPCTDCPHITRKSPRLFLSGRTPGHAHIPWHTAVLLQAGLWPPGLLGPPVQGQSRCTRALRVPQVPGNLLPTVTSKGTCGFPGAHVPVTAAVLPHPRFRPQALGRWICSPCPPGSPPVDQAAPPCPHPAVGVTLAFSPCLVSTQRGQLSLQPFQQQGLDCRESRTPRKREKAQVCANLAKPQTAPRVNQPQLILSLVLNLVPSLPGFPLEHPSQLHSPGPQAHVLHCRPWSGPCTNPPS